MMADVLGALNAAMPSPTTARHTAMRHSGADSGVSASSSIPAAMATMPPLARTREPMRSLRRPLNGLSTAISSGMLSSSHPVSDAELSRTSSR